MMFPKDRRDLAGFWLFLAVSSLVFSGMLTLLVGGARMPLIAALIHDTSFTKRVLVVHVDLGVLTWFAAIPVALYHLWMSVHEKSIHFLQRVTPITAVTGTLLICGGLLLTDSPPLLVNYVPLIDHWIYRLGLALIFVSVGVSFFDPALFKCLRSRISGTKVSFPGGPLIPTPVLNGFHSARFGLMTGAIYYFLALVSFGFAVYFLDRSSFQDDAARYFETLMWGPGHVLQMVNVVFAVVAWTLLASYLNKKEVITSGLLRVVFLWLSLPSVAILYLNFVSPADEFYRSTYTKIMQWGIFPPLLLFLGGLARTWPKGVFVRGNAVYVNLVFSIVLILLGFILGAFINGPDLRIPGHYHASIGSVTLAYMGLAMLFMGKRNAVGEFEAPENQRALYWTSWIYGIGQIVFSCGMFIGGIFGMARKTYGVDQSVNHPGQNVGFAIMAVGGLLAFAGGGTFAIFAIKWLMSRVGAPRKVS